jgi:hypothetical protein
MGEQRLKAATSPPPPAYNIIHIFALPAACHIYFSSK